MVCLYSEDNIHACPWQSLVPGGTWDCAVVRAHSSASCSKTRTRWRRSSRCGLVAYAPPISWQAAGAGTVERHLYGSWMLTQIDLAHPDGKCHKRAGTLFHRLESRPADLSCRRQRCLVLSPFLSSSLHETKESIT